MGTRLVRTLAVSALLTTALTVAVSETPTTADEAAPNPALADLDPSFGGGDGVTIDSLHPGADIANEVALQADGKILVVGRLATDGYVARYDEDGGLDPSFGTGGVHTIDLGGTDEALAVAALPDGDIVVTGSSVQPAGCTTCTGYGFITRLDVNGSTDTAFGTGGTTVTPLTTQAWSAGWFQLRVIPGPSVVVAGSDGADIVVGRYTASGSLDPGFGGDGLATVDFGAADTYPGGIAMQPDGSLLVGGGTSSASSALHVARLTVTGTLDPAFGEDGIASHTIPDTGTRQETRGVLVLPDGRIVAGGTVSEPGARGSEDFALVAFTTTGSLDQAFGTAGSTITDFEGADDTLMDLSIQGDRIVAAGWGTYLYDFVFHAAVARYTADGNLDTSFSGNGWAIVTAESIGWSALPAVATDASGRLVAVGVASHPGGEDDTLLLRVLPNGNHAEEAKPVITGITPSSGGPGDTVTITGTGFSAATQVLFADLLPTIGQPAASFTVVSPTTITAVAPDWIDDGPLGVRTTAGTAISRWFETPSEYEDRLTLDAPLHGARVRGVVGVSATVAGAGEPVVRVQFEVDDVTIVTDSDGSDGWTAAWDSTAHGPGPAVVTVTAFDADGGVGVDQDRAVVVVASPPVADFDGDGDSDIGVYRNGGWLVRGQTTVFYGIASDIPVPRDYDGDGDTDIAVFRPSTGAWYIRGQTTTYHGTSTDIPVPGDYDGDGDTDIAVYRPTTGRWYIRGGESPFFGASTDIPVPGDYDGNGTTDIAVFRPSTGAWYIRGGESPFFGASTDIPVPGDYDGNGTTDIAVFRPATGAWYIRGQATTYHGTSTDVPLRA